MNRRTGVPGANWTFRRLATLVSLGTFLTTACYKTQTYNAPIDSAAIEAAEERGKIRVVKNDGRGVDLDYLDSWRIQGDTLLGYTKPPEEGMRADWVIPLSEIESLEITTREISTAEGAVLGIAAAGVTLLLLFGALYGASTT